MRSAVHALLVSTLLTLSAIGADLKIDAAFDGSRWIAAREAIAIRLSRPVTPEDGRVAVMIGESDVTAMFEPVAGALVWRRDGVPLPAGEHEVVVSLVEPSGTWREVARFPIRVLTRRGFQKANAKPSLDLMNKGQIDHHQLPDDSFTSRDRYQDLMGQASLSTEHERGSYALRTQMNLTGVTYANEALRFSELGDRAPMIDLSSYKVELQRGPLQLTAGQVSFGSHRHLINGLGSRGLILTLGAGQPVSLALGAMNGTGIVGWDNFLGLQSPEHRVFSATLGFELVPSRPGTVRLETSLLDGSLLPQSSFNQGAVRSAEKSTGGSVRLLLANASKRFTVDAGFTRSRFSAGLDEQLEEGLEVVALREDDREAAYLDLGYALLQNASFIGKQQANLSLGFNFETIDPLFRSVATSLQPDQQRGMLSLSGNAGPLIFQFGHARSEDNLDGIRSILKTKTRESSANVGLVLGPLFGARRGARWIPELSVNATHVHQFGAWLPEDGGFSASHVPDQISIGAQGAVEWRLQTVRFGYRGSLSQQDNRQPGRETADLSGDASTYFFGFTPAERFDVTLESSIERLRNTELGQRDRLRRHGGTLTWRVWRDVALSGNYSWLYGRDAAWTNERGSNEGFIDLSSGFSFWQSSAQRNRSRVFLRYSTRDSSTFDRIFDARSSNEGWSLTSGVNLSVF